MVPVVEAAAFIVDRAVGRSERHDDTLNGRVLVVSTAKAEAEA